MNPYEILLMLDPELPDERQTEIVTRTRELIERSGGTWDGHDVWGRRKLAYEIQHRTEGYYVVFQARSEPPAMDELHRTLSLADEVVRHKVLRIPEKVYGPPKVAGTAAESS